MATSISGTSPPMALRFSTRFCTRLMLPSMASPTVILTVWNSRLAFILFITLLRWKTPCSVDHISAVVLHPDTCSSCSDPRVSRMMVLAFVSRRFHKAYSRSSASVGLPSSSSISSRSRSARTIVMR